MPCREVLEGLNATVDSCASSSNAQFSSSLHPYTAQQQRHIRGMLAEAYDLVVTEVVTHRQLSFQQVGDTSTLSPSDAYTRVACSALHSLLLEQEVELLPRCH